MRHFAHRPNRATGTTIDPSRSIGTLLPRLCGDFAVPVTTSYLPPVDVIETPAAYLIRVELPGIDPKDVDVTLTGDTLTIRGEKAVDEDLTEESSMLVERTTGKFERSFRLPAAATGEVDACARHGVLAIRIPKAPDAQPHRITVRQA